MNLEFYINQLSTNKLTFDSIFSNVPEELIKWRQEESKWSMIEILCHLYDEEKEDFRARLKYVIEQPESLPLGINPGAWVTERAYADQDYEAKLENFLDEREKSVNFLRSLDNPPLDNFYNHASLGPLNGHHFLANWVAHDYLHMRQATKLKYDFLTQHSGQNLDYAGEWK